MLNLAKANDSIKILNQRFNFVDASDGTVPAISFLSEGRFECDIQYQLASEPTVGYISLSALDISSSRFIAALDPPVAVGRTVAPKIQHVVLQFSIPNKSLEQNIPSIKIGAFLLDGTKKSVAQNTFEFGPRDWLYISHASANNLTVYSSSDVAQRGMPDPDVNGNINLSLKIYYLQNSSPNGGFINLSVTGAGGLTLAQKDVPPTRSPVGISNSLFHSKRAPPKVS